MGTLTQPRRRKQERAGIGNAHLSGRRNRGAIVTSQLLHPAKVIQSKPLELPVTEFAHHGQCPFHAGGCGQVVAAMYTDDVIHDVVASPHGALQGPEAARGFYEFLTASMHTEQMQPSHAWYGGDFCVIEHQWTGTVRGEFAGIPGNGRRISFQLLHVWEFKNGRMSRENVWLDSGEIIGQLTEQEPAGAVSV